MNNTLYDIIIIGGGPSGLTAGIYASRSKMKTLLIEKMGCGGQVAITDAIENYPGFPEGINGFELASKFEQQARRFGLEIVYDDVSSISISAENPNEKIIKTGKTSYRSLAVIISSGASHKKLGVPGEVEFTGKGVSYCATCDGPFFRDKDVVVVGGGDSAVQEAIYLTRFVKKVTLIHRRDELRAVKLLQERAKSNPKIELLLKSVVVDIKGGDTVEGLTVKDVQTGKESSVEASGVFMFVGYVPNTGFVKQFVELDEHGSVTTDNDMQTSVPGVYACGDVRRKLLKQVVTAAGEGAAAAFAAEQYIEELR